MFFFFFNDTATTEIYTLSLHDALPISAISRISPMTSPILPAAEASPAIWRLVVSASLVATPAISAVSERSEEHTSELQSRQYLVCRLLLEKKKKKHGWNENKCTYSA